jgi:DNA-binding response OmpR family regulator
MTATNKGTVLIAEDERSIRVLLRTYLETEGYRVREAADGRETLAEIARVVPDTLLLDLSMPPPQGMEVLRFLRTADMPRKPAVIILTAYGSVKLAVEAMKLGALEFLEKPASPEVLLTTLERVHAEQMLAQDKSLDSYDALLARARIALSDGEFDRAESLLLRAAPLGKEDPLYWNLLGLYAELGGDLDLARKYYGHALRQNSNYAPAQQNMRRLYELRTFGRSDEPPALSE